MASTTFELPPIEMTLTIRHTPMGRLRFRAFLLLLRLAVLIGGFGRVEIEQAKFDVHG